MNDIIPLADMDRMAQVAAASKMFGFKTKEEALAIMLLCQAENMHPAIAMRDYNVIQGRPALKADAMLARFQAAGGKVKWNELSDQKVSGTFSHSSGGDATISWTFADAQKIGLTGKDNWKKYPRAMLRSRVVSEGIRTVFPGVIVGVYTPEEVGDMGETAVTIEHAPVASPESTPPAEVSQSPEGLNPQFEHTPIKAQPKPAPKPADVLPEREIAKHTFETIKIGIANALDNADIDEMMSANIKGLKTLEIVSPVNWAKLRDLVTKRRQELGGAPADEFEDEVPA